MSSLVVAAVLMSINGKMKRRSGFGTIIAKTRGHVLSPLINIINLWAESKMGLKQKIEEGLRIGSCVSIWATLAVYP